jgi:hypothetical protein
MLGIDFQSAKRQWDLEVEREAVELIECGVPPYDAMERARNIVSARRRQKRLTEAAKEKERP